VCSSDLNRVPATEELHSLASILGVTTDWLISGKGDPKPVNYHQLAVHEKDCVGSSYLRDEPQPIGHSDEILKLSETADVPALMETLESLNRRSNAGDIGASKTLAKLIPIVCKRVAVHFKRNPPNQS
jgi:hypothetical protein